MSNAGDNALKKINDNVVNHLVSEKIYDQLNHNWQEYKKIIDEKIKKLYQDQEKTNPLPELLRKLEQAKLLAQFKKEWFLYVTSHMINYELTFNIFKEASNHIIIYAGGAHSEMVCDQLIKDFYFKDIINVGIGIYTNLDGIMLSHAAWKFLQESPQVSFATYQAKGPIISLFSKQSIDVLVSILRKQTEVTLETVKALVEEGIKTYVDIVNAQDDVNPRKTLLHRAVEQNNVDIVQFLLQRGALANIKDAVGRIPLYYAIQNNNGEIVCKLLAHGSHYEFTDIEEAITKDAMEATECLLAKSAKDNPTRTVQFINRIISRVSNDPMKQLLQDYQSIKEVRSEYLSLSSTLSKLTKQEAFDKMIDIILNNPRLTAAEKRRLITKAEHKIVVLPEQIGETRDVGAINKMFGILRFFDTLLEKEYETYFKSFDLDDRTSGFKNGAHSSIGGVFTAPHTLLELAVSGMHKYAVAYLLEQGVDPNKRALMRPQDNSLLFEAIQNKKDINLDIPQLLARSGAKPKNQNEQTALGELLMAKQKSNQEMQNRYTQIIEDPQSTQQAREKAQRALDDYRKIGNTIEFLLQQIGKNKLLTHTKFTKHGIHSAFTDAFTS